jgi:hypothetical protein
MKIVRGKMKITKIKIAKWGKTKKKNIKKKYIYI